MKHQLERLINLAIEMLQKQEILPSQDLPEYRIEHSKDKNMAILQLTQL